MNRNINVLNKDQEVTPLVIDENQVIQTIGHADLFPHLPKHVRKNIAAVKSVGYDPLIIVVAPLDNRTKHIYAFDLSARPIPYEYHVTVEKELSDVGIHSRAQVHRECQQQRDIALGISRPAQKTNYQLYSTLAT